MIFRHTGGKRARAVASIAGIVIWTGIIPTALPLVPPVIPVRPFKIAVAEASVFNVLTPAQQQALATLVEIAQSAVSVQEGVVGQLALVEGVVGQIALSEAVVDVITTQSVAQGCSVASEVWFSIKHRMIALCWSIGRGSDGLTG